jgi:hypothetical protein
MFYGSNWEKSINKTKESSVSKDYVPDVSKEKNLEQIPLVTHYRSFSQPKYSYFADSTDPKGQEG